MTSPTIRLWICPDCGEMDRSWPDHLRSWCEGVPVEYVACPTSAAHPMHKRIGSPLLIPAPGAATDA